MKVKRKGVANENAKDMCIQVSHPLGSDTSYSNGVSTSNSISYLGVGHVGHDGIAPVYPAIVSDGVRSGVLGSTSFCGSIPGSSSGNVSTMGITHMVDGYPFENAVHDTHLDQHSLLHSGVEAQLDPPINIPVQVPTIDGSVSVFQSNNIMYPSYTVVRSAGVPQVVERPSVYGHQSATHIPMVLDFSTGSVTRAEDLTVSSSTIRLAAPQTREAARPTRQAGRRHVLAARRRILNVFVAAYKLTIIHSCAAFHVSTARPRVTASVNPPAQGPVAPPQRQGAPLDYKCFGRCDQVHERYALRESIIEGLIGFLDDNNALVKLFRTAREKVQRADIPNFTIRLFGVAGANQYELPTADSVGAIVYEGGPESMTDYDVVIERHSGEPESVNKLHPAYMALQFPLLFIYGEEGYHLRLKLRNVDGNDDQQEKKMSMKLYYAYQLHDRRRVCSRPGGCG
ncbi:Retrotransposon-like protein [Artemisia annua]|uniref:Retrotransposon-like protein n=1 Tax=Artemisia annua TaxID=35608 RepID=A0A2U1KCK2_ARTAN|nr:Retrotransposon-like protein [Artemisia annua]